MGKLLARLIAGLLLISTIGYASAPQVLNERSAREQIKRRQKEERRALKLKQKYTKDSMKNQGLPKSERARMRHELKREARDLHQRQKDERQDLKDRQKSIKEAQKWS